AGGAGTPPTASRRPPQRRRSRGRSRGACFDGNRLTCAAAQRNPLPAAAAPCSDGDTTKGVPIMGMDDKVEYKAEELAGKAKQAVGDATDDRSMQAEGKMDEAKADMKQAGEKVKDAFR